MLFLIDFFLCASAQTLGEQLDYVHTLDGLAGAQCCSEDSCVPPYVRCTTDDVFVVQYAPCQGVCVCHPCLMPGDEIRDQLPRLRYFGANDASLQGTLPRFADSVLNIVMVKNQLTRADNELPPQLENLYLSNNLLTSAAALQALPTTLQKIAVDQNPDLDAPFPYISGLSALQEFYGYRTQLRGSVSDFGDALAKLHVSDAKLTKFPPSLRNLESADFSRNSIDDVLPALTGAIQTLRVSGNAKLHGTMPSTLRNLRVFDASHCNLRGGIPLISAAFEELLISVNRLSGPIDIDYNHPNLVTCALADNRNDKEANCFNCANANFPLVCIDPNWKKPCGEAARRRCQGPPSPPAPTPLPSPPPSPLPPTSTPVPTPPTAQQEPTPLPTPSSDSSSTSPTVPPRGNTAAAAEDGILGTPLTQTEFIGAVVGLVVLICLAAAICFFASRSSAGARDRSKRSSSANFTVSRRHRSSRTSYGSRSALHRRPSNVNMGAAPMAMNPLIFAGGANYGAAMDPTSLYTPAPAAGATRDSEVYLYVKPPANAYYEGAGQLHFTDAAAPLTYGAAPAPRQSAAGYVGSPLSYATSMPTEPPSAALLRDVTSHAAYRASMASGDEAERALRGAPPSSAIVRPSSAVGQYANVVTLSHTTPTGGINHVRVTLSGDELVFKTTNDRWKRVPSVDAMLEYLQLKVLSQ